MADFGPSDADEAVAGRYDVLSGAPNGAAAGRHDVRSGTEGVLEPVRGPRDLILTGHDVSFSARARAARPRAAVDLTVPRLMPSMAAISASDSSR